jgi:hypothetical protein
MHYRTARGAKSARENLTQGRSSRAHVRRRRAARALRRLSPPPCCWNDTQRDTGKPVRTALKQAIRVGLHRRGHQHQPRRLVIGDKLEDMHAQLEHERDGPTSLGIRANTPSWNESQHTKSAHTSDRLNGLKTT